MKEVQFDIQRFDTDAGTEVKKVSLEVNGNTIKSGTSTTTETITPPNVPTMPETVESPFILGTNDNDTIKNTKSNVLIYSGAGNDSIENYPDYDGDFHSSGDSVSIYGGDGNDTIYNRNGDYVLINGGEGDDSIENYGGDVVTIEGGAGDDEIYTNGGRRILLNGGTGADKIIMYQYSANSTIFGGDGGDSIWNDAPSVTVDGGMDNDYINNWPSGVSIFGGDGNDTLYNNGSSYVTINGGNGNDFIENIRYFDHNLQYTKIYGGDGSDTVYNNGDSVRIDAGAGNDSIYSKKGYANTINGGDGDDTIYGSHYINGGLGDDYIISDGGTIDAGEGNNVISLAGSFRNVTVNGVASIVSAKFNVNVDNGDDTVYGLDENDILHINGTKYTTVKSGNDIRIIVSNGSILVKDKTNIDFNITVPVGTSISGSNLNASRDFKGNKIDLSDYEGITGVTAYTVSQNVSIIGTSTANGISGGNGDDSIYGGSGDDYLYGGDGNDTLNGGVGNDYLSDDEGNDVLYGGAGDDYLSGGQGNNTLIGGAGNDNIYIYGYYHGSKSYNLIQYNNGDDNDTVDNISSNDTIKITGAKYSTLSSGNDIKIIVGNGSILIKNKDRIDFTIDGTLESGTDTTPADTLPVGISVKNSVVTASTLFSGSKIELSDYENATNVNVSAVSQAVSIVGTATNNSLKGGKGNDTLVGGAGNDTVSLGGGADIYIYSSGNDLIQDYVSGQDKIKISSGSISSASVSNSNVILNINNGGKITIQNGKDKEITVIDSKGEEFKFTSNDITEEPVTDSKRTKTQQEVMKDFMKALDDGKSKDEAIKLASNGLYASTKDLKDHFYSDLKLNKTSTISPTNIWNILEKICGIDTSKVDNGSITGRDTGGDTFPKKTNESIIPETTKAYHLETIKSNETLAIFKDLERDGRDLKIIKNNLTLIVPNYYKDKNSFETTFTKDEIEIVNGLYSWWLKGALNLVDESYELNFDKNDVKFKTMTLKFENADSGNIAGFTQLFHDLVINLHYFSNFNIEDNPDGYVEFKYKGEQISAYLDQTLAHEFTHAVMAANINNFWSLPVYLREGTAILTAGEEYANAWTMQILVENYYNGGNLLKNALSDTSIKIFGASDCYPAGYMLMRYFAKQTSENILPIGLNYDKNWTTITETKSFSGDSINLNSFAPTVIKVNVAAANQALNIVGNASDNSIKGGKGDDTISGSIGNNTLTGGAGQDVFIFSDGNDLITDYKSGEDKIKIETITTSTVKGSDIILTTGNGTLTIKGAKDKVVAFVDDGGKITEKIFFGDTSYAPLETGLTYDSKRVALTASTKFNGKEIDLSDYLSTVEKVNVSALSNGVNVVGNTANNSIKGGKDADTISGGIGKDTILGGNGNDLIYGGSDDDVLKGETGNDTLSSGKGNDTLTGGAGNDVFVYDGGNDVITDFFTGQNTIKIASGTITSASVKSTDVILNTSAGSITVKNGKDKKITVTDGDGNTASEYYGLMNYNADKTALTLSSAFSTSLKSTDYATTVKKIDASAVSKSINVSGNSQNNTIIGSGKAETIYGGSGNDSIMGNAGNDKLFGDAGSDTLNGGKGNDTLTGGDGNDVFFYANGDGNDVIADFTAGQDSIYLASGTVASASLKSSDMVFKIGSGTLTVKNAKNKEISIGNSVYYNNLIYDTNKISVTLGAGFSGSLKSSDYASTIKTINASGLTKSTNIVGNSLNNTIVGSSKAETVYGGSGNDSIVGNAGNDKLFGDAGNDILLGGDGNDSLYGGLGNDTLTGGKGNDIFVYEGGNDTITDYTAGQDKIKITSGSITKTSYSGNNVIFSVGSGSITVLNGKGKKISITDSNKKTTTLTYNPEASKISNNALWFTVDDNNFITDEFNLDSVVDFYEKNYSVGQVEFVEKNNEFTTCDSLVSAVYFNDK